MKAFEEWFEKQSLYLPATAVDHYCWSESVWKAALEWAMDSAGGNMDWDKLEKELEDESV